MNNLQLKQIPIMKTGMLIRKSVAEVFEAFINPDITTKFWFTKSSGRLEAGKKVEWTWEMYGVSATVDAKVIEPNKRIIIEWPGYSGLSRSHLKSHFDARFVNEMNNVSEFALLFGRKFHSYDF
jgi:uncharacterized protein YndB with AHSA1/START domain